MSLLAKLLKIHVTAFCSFWITLGMILATILKANKAYCVAHPSNETEGVSHCSHDLTDVTETIGMIAFGVFTTLSGIGGLFIIITFVHMLKKTQGKLENIG